jgi:hypothetical protein
LARSREHYITTKLEMIEEQVDVKILAAHLETHLLADEREARAKLDEELADVGQQPFLKGFLLELVGDRQELELVRILERLASKV